MLDGVNRDLEVHIDNEHWTCVWRILENELDFDIEPSTLLVSEANYQVVKNPTIEKTLEEGSSKAEKKVKEKSKEKCEGKEKGQEKENTKKKAREKAKNKKSNLVKLNLIGEKTCSICKETMYFEI